MYVIYLASDPDLVLTAVDLSDGGNVQFKTYTGASNQKWSFIDVSTDLSVSANPPSPNAQNKTEWCWAAATRIVTMHNSGKVNSEITQSPQRLENLNGIRSAYCRTNSSGETIVDGVQRSIVIQVKGSDLNDIGSLENMKQALEYVHPGDAEYTRVGDLGVSLGTSDRERLKSEVQSGRYVMAGLSKQNSDIGHVIAITGYNSSTNEYTIIDPWVGTEVPLREETIFGYNISIPAGNNYRLEYYFVTTN